jgi:type IV pilus assembly protein PilY1
VRQVSAKFVQQTMASPSLTARTITNNQVDFDVKNGWYVDLNPGNTSPGERVNLDLTLVRGVLIVTTNAPNNDACSDVANGFLYQIDFRTGAPIPGTTIAGGQIASSLLVGSVFYRTTTGALIGLTRASTGTPIRTPVSSGGAGGSAQRVSWRELVQ